MFHLHNLNNVKATLLNERLNRLAKRVLFDRLPPTAGKNLGNTEPFYKRPKFAVNEFFSIFVGRMVAN